MSPSPLLAPGARARLAAVEAFERSAGEPTRFSRCYRELILSCYRRLVPPGSRVLEIGCGEGDLLAGLSACSRTGIDLSPERVARGRERHPGLDLRVGAGETAELPEGPFDVIILSEVLNQAADAELLLARLHGCSHSGTRLILNVYNTLWRPLLSLARGTGLAPRRLPANWLSRQDVINLCALSDWEVFTGGGRILLPLPLGPFSCLINRWLAPLVGWACLAIFLTARSTRRVRVAADAPEPRVSVIVPARNEEGNIPRILDRIPRLGSETEVIFVEGHSADGTWRAIEALPERFAHGPVRRMRQPGVGKADAVRAGFRAATGDLLLILDADLSTPPEDLPKFTEAIRSGKGDVANGVRLVYPMEGRAMRFANLCANKAFGLLFSWLLGQPVKDTLCGTKAMRAADWRRLEEARAGDFDPFGDFDLLLGAARLNLRIVDVPIRYADRTYGTTNISRWRHGVMLARIVAAAAVRLKFV